MKTSTKHSEPARAKGGMTFTARARVAYWVRTVLILAFAAVCAIPLWYVLISTFKSGVEMYSDPLGLPKQWVFGNYAKAFEELPILRSFFNTLFVTVFGVVFQVAIDGLIRPRKAMDDWQRDFDRAAGND